MKIKEFVGGGSLSSKSRFTGEEKRVFFEDAVVDVLMEYCLRDL
jgi:hypothetical protein